MRNSSVDITNIINKNTNFINSLKKSNNRINKEDKTINYRKSCQPKKNSFLDNRNSNFDINENYLNKSRFKQLEERKLSVSRPKGRASLLDLLGNNSLYQFQRKIKYSIK